MKSTSLTVQFPNDKIHRKCIYFLRQFARVKALLTPSSMQEHKDLIRKRGFTKQYRSDSRKTFYPTTAGWEAFLQFSNTLHLAEPFATRSTRNDTFQAALRGFANMLSDGLLPEEIYDLVEYFPEDFKLALLVRAERRFCKLQGINISDNISFAIGNCWIGNFETLNFDTISESEADFKRTAVDAINDVFESDSTFIAGSRVLGTAERVKEETAFQWDLTLSILCLLLNLSYKSVFHLLWQVRVLDKPESGFSKQGEFSIIEEGVSKKRKKEFSISTRYLSQWMELDKDKIDTWHEDLRLNILNRLVSHEEFGSVELENKLVSALLYFRQAANQSTTELQMSTLWVSVEVFFTAENKGILNANVEKLVAITKQTLHSDFWPGNAKSGDDLKAIFKKYYSYRSSTLHHGRRGHVSVQDVQEFSQVVGAVILGAAFRIWSDTTFDN